MDIDTIWKTYPKDRKYVGQFYVFPTGGYGHSSMNCQYFRTTVEPRRRSVFEADGVTYFEEAETGELIKVGVCEQCPDKPDLRWAEQGACWDSQDMDLHDVDPKVHEPAAEKHCLSCPVAAECYAFGLSQFPTSRNATWGGVYFKNVYSQISEERRRETLDGKRSDFERLRRESGIHGTGA